MSDNTKIEWTDATANVINGCTVHSAGCTNCYAMKLAGTRMRNHPTRVGLTQDTKAGPVWTGEVRFNGTALLQVLRWKKPRMIFWNAHGDMFHENVPDAWIDRCFAVMALTPHHTHQVLTKRADRMRSYFEKPRLCDVISDSRSMVWDAAMDIATDTGLLDKYQPTVWPLPNVWLGVSVENQAAADERIPDLLATPAAVRWISAEPLIGPVDLTRWLHDEGCPAQSTFCICSEPREVHLNWVVCGGESGPKARPMHPDWARSLRDQCAAAGVPFLFKQWGEWIDYNDAINVDGIDILNCRTTGDGGKTDIQWLRVGKKAAGRHLDGVLHDAFPAREA